MSYFNSDIEPMEFIETDYDSACNSAINQLKYMRESTPPYNMQLVEELVRSLWQDYDDTKSLMSQSSKSSGVYSGDDQMEVDIKEETEIPKVISDIGCPQCTSHGACSKCKLPRETEEPGQSEKAKSTQQ